MLENFTESPADPKTTDDPTGIVSYVMDLVTRWRKYRDGNYQENWEKYDAIYRGQWNDRLRVKAAERSRIITPATTNAVDQSVSEIVEAIFGRGKWFDVDMEEPAKDDQQGQMEMEAAEQLRDQLQTDMHRDGVKTAIIHCVTNGAKFGTGILKRIVDTDEEFTPTDPRSTTERKYVTWESIPPRLFVIDSAATSVHKAHGCAHEQLVTKHMIVAKQQSGEYREGQLGSAAGFGSANVLSGPNGQTYEKDPLDGVYITEYHGLIPRRLLEGLEPTDENSDPLSILEEDQETGEETDAENERPYDETDLVEAIVVIANGTLLLKAVENPILGHDRGFIAYQHYNKPDSFWGMGVIEKAYNAQMALDAEIRARMDTLALITYPSITADATRLPRNLDLTVTPGKVFRTNGRGSEIIEPLKFGNLDPVTFQHSADLERYVQMATGASDPSTPVNTNRSPQATASGNSMQFGSYIKRAKLPMQNIDENLLDPLVRKSLLAYMTIDPDRYPAMFDYSVNSTLSIMAREFEQMQLTNLMALLPQGSPEYSIVLKAIIENYSGPSKDKILAAIEQSQQGNPQQQQMQQLQIQTAAATLQKLQAEIQEIGARATYTKSKIPTEQYKLHQKDTELHIQTLEAHTDQEKVRAQETGVAVQHHGNILSSLTKVHATRMQGAIAKHNAAQKAKAPAK